MADNVFSVNDRVDYYYGAPSIKDNSRFTSEFLRDEIFIFDLNSLIKTPGSYYSDMRGILSSVDNNDISVPVAFGDKTHDIRDAFFCKARKVKSKSGILVRLNKKRHWLDLKGIYDSTSFSEKKSKVVWRGATTGYEGVENNPRYQFVKKYFNEHNVGFSSVSRNRIGNEDWERYLLGRLTIAEQLEYKYIVVLEGNDVATSLKWVLLSNSIPIMNVPTKETWLMEGVLKPYEHYLPLLTDMSNLEELILWAENNLEQCQKIIKNGKEHMSMFKDEHLETYIERLLVQRYISSD